MPETERLRGQFRSINEARGFGFIRDENGQDYFVHIVDTPFFRDASGSWSEALVGREVMFSARPSQAAGKCPTAVGITVVER